MENMNHEIAQTVSKPNGAKAPPPEGLMIPKHRFDCVNLCLKETKQTLRDKTAEADAGQARVIELEEALLDAKVDAALALHRAKNLVAVKALVDFSDLKLGQDGDVPGLEEEILRIKESQSYLFESGESAMYVLVPVKSGDGLNKSITNYIKRSKVAE